MTDAGSLHGNTDIRVRPPPPAQSFGKQHILGGGRHYSYETTLRCISIVTTNHSHTFATCASVNPYQVTLLAIWPTRNIQMEVLGIHEPYNTPRRIEKSNMFYTSLAVLIVSLVIYAVGVIIYNVFFRPLANIPGPKLAAITCLCFFATDFSGDSFRRILKWHQAHGTEEQALKTQA